MSEKKNLPRLSKRLQMAERMVSPCGTMADVGCDHAHLSINLVSKGIAKRAIAMDVRKGPLMHAKENSELYGCSQMIELRLSDGLESLGAGEAETIVITGMGGVLMTTILKEGRAVLKAAQELVLSPQSHPELVRSFILDAGFEITEEDVCRDGPKFYTAIKARKRGDGAKEACGAEAGGRRSAEGLQAAGTEAGSRRSTEGLQAAGTGADGGQKGFRMPPELAAFAEKLSTKSGNEDDGAVQIDRILKENCSLEEEARLRYGDPAVYAGKEAYLDFLLYEKKKTERILGSLKENGQESAGKETERFARRLEVIACAMSCRV